MEETIKPDFLKVFLALLLFSIGLSLTIFIVHSLMNSELTIKEIIENLFSLLYLLPIFLLKLILISLLGALLLSHFNSVTVSDKGLIAFDTLGRKTFIAWNDIDAIKCIPIPGMPLLLLSSRKLKWSVWASKNLTTTTYLSKDLKVTAQQS